jgi:hypothetical protein
VGRRPGCDNGFELTVSKACGTPRPLAVLWSEQAVICSGAYHASSRLHERPDSNPLEEIKTWAKGVLMCDVCCRTYNSAPVAALAGHLVLVLSRRMPEQASQGL